MTHSPGTRLGGYEILSLLGAGGMGEVYRARDLRLGREVAVKVLPAALSASPDRLARFEREARTVAALNHPNIVILHSIEEADGAPFLTLELVEGERLDSGLAPGGLPVSRVLALAIPLADALAAAHDRGVVHRDLKPANVMVTGEGRVKVLDFGLAKLAEEAQSLDETATVAANAQISRDGQVVGTAPYMAPEQIRGGAVDARADLFALGVILYELLGGRRPFAGKTGPDVSSAILRDPPPPLHALRGDLPPDLERIVARCLEKDPERRVQTAKDVRNELELLRRTLESGVEPSASSARHAPATEQPSIAVLPFVNRSRDEDDEYFADGLTDELLTVLAKIKGLRVAARSSAFHFKGKGATVDEVGRALNVATVLEGTVRKAGARVRIAVQLVKVADGYQLWSETYDRTLEDIFAVQDDIAQSVVKELRSTLLGEAADSGASGEARAEVQAAARDRGENDEAHRLFLRGRFLVERLGPGDITQGIEVLRQAIALNPRHALAWTWLSYAHEYQAGYGLAPVAEGYARAREAVMQALALAPDLAEPHLALGTIQKMHDWDWKSAERSFRRALELEPDNSKALHLAASLAQYLGEGEEAVRLGRRALELDPLAAGGHISLGMTYRALGRNAEAEECFRQGLEISPGRIGTRLALCAVLTEMGRLDEALATAEEEGEEWARLTGLAIVHHLAGRPEASVAALERLVGEYAEDAAVQIACVHALRGETENAFTWLDRAYAQRDAGLPGLKLEPALRSLHGDPRWPALLARMGLAD
ncbi:protein kinase [bacterium]|nr:protein kinase [bacterium]